MNAVGDGLHVGAEPKRKPPRRRSGRRRQGRESSLAKYRRGTGRDYLLGRRRGRRLLILDVPPPGTARRLAAAPARALRISERQTHLECEIAAQEVWEIGAVGTKDHLHRVFAETQMIEKEIACRVAQHLMQRRPRWRRVQRIVEKLLDPCREQVFRPAPPMRCAKATRCPPSPPAAAAGRRARRSRG
jgi:hypothetical protein